ncbi:MAG: HEPN domain-containing protein [Ignisphaera sp.]
MSEYKWWFEQASKDLRKAENAISTEDYDAAAFWSHQAAEKALKALLLSRGYPARGHSLIELARRVREELDIAVEPILDDLRELNPHYIISRYPNAANAPPYQLYTRDKALELLSRARRVLEWVKQYLQ